MKIENVKENKDREYPKKGQVSKRELKNNIPHLWSKLSLSFVAVLSFFKEKIFAVTLEQTEAMTCTIGAHPKEVSTFESVSDVVLKFFFIPAVIVLVVSAIIDFIVAKKTEEKSVVRKILRAIIALSIVIASVAIVLWVILIGIE